MMPPTPQPTINPHKSDGRSREELRAEILRLEAELQRQAEAAQTTAKRWASFRLFTAWVGARAFAGSQLYQKSVDAWNAWSTWLRSGISAPWPESATRDFAAALLARFTRVGVVVLVFAALPLVVALLQLNVLNRQNKLIHLQTELAESARRSTLVFEQSSILDEIDEELDALPNGVATGNVFLSPRLEGRIVAFSRSLRPYRYLDGDQLTRAPLSPERGQLLLALINSQIELSSMVSQADFSYADLSGINFRAPAWSATSRGNRAPTPSSYRLLRIDLSGASFRSSTIGSLLFESSRLPKSTFQNSFVYSTVFAEAQLDSANFSHAVIRGSRFISVGLSGADFTSASLLGVTFVETDFSNAIFDDARLRHVRFEDERERSWDADALQLCRARAFSNVTMPTALLEEMQKNKACARKLVRITASD
jgi:uncharacterized protein YjbI with pentapeptide repeats